MTRTFKMCYATQSEALSKGEISIHEYLDSLEPLMEKKHLNCRVQISIDDLNKEDDSTNGLCVAG